MAPMIRNFIPASLERPLIRNAAMAAMGRLDNSSAT